MKRLYREALDLQAVRSKLGTRLGRGSRQERQSRGPARSWPPLGIPRLKLTPRWLKPELRGNQKREVRGRETQLAASRAWDV